MTRFKSDSLRPNAAPTEITKLENAIKKVKGVELVKTRVGEGRIDVDHDNEVKTQDIKDAAKRAGFPCAKADPTRA
jgi:copper chaperone CopZ